MLEVKAAGPSQANKDLSPASPYRRSKVYFHARNLRFSGMFKRSHNIQTIAHRNGRTFLPIRIACVRMLCVLLPLLLLEACGKTSAQTEFSPPKVTVAQPQRMTVTDYLELAGNTQAVNTVQLVARVPGYLERVFFHDGQIVKGGQTLFLIEQDTYEQSLRQAEASILQFQAQLNYAETQLKRYSDLVHQEAVPQSDVDNWQFQRDTAQANLKAAEAQRDLAVINLGYTEVRAPFDGRMDRRLVDPGNLVGSGGNTVLAQIAQIDPIYVYFNISDTDLARLTGQAHWTPDGVRNLKWPILTGFPEDKGYPHQGYIDFAAISLTATTGTLLLRGVFYNPDGSILPGLYSKVRVPVEKRTAFMVPDEAIAYDQQGSYILTVDDKNVVERHNVKTGTSVKNLRAITEGLSGGEWVIVKGLLRSIPGQQVTPVREGIEPRSASSQPPTSRRGR